MTQQEILQIIADNFLCVRRLPFEVISHWCYNEGDENKLGGFEGKPVYTESGEVKNIKREVITNFGNWPKDKKFIKEIRTVDKGGWWYVKEVKNTSSLIEFNRRDAFFAPTLEEAVQLYLNSKL